MYVANEGSAWGRHVRSPAGTAAPLPVPAGPDQPLLRRARRGTARLGHAAHRINLCLGDRVFWPGSDATEFYGRPADWPGFVAAYLAREHISDLVLLGEQRPYHRAAIAAARAQGVAVTVTDYGYLRPDWIVLERDGMGAEKPLPA